MADQNPLGDHMQGRINNLFNGQELPTPANLREVEAMKLRIKALEAQLMEQAERVDKAEQEASSKSRERTAPVKVVEPTISLIPRSSADGNASWISRGWDALTKASAEITDAGERNSARLGASFLLIIALLEFIGGLARIPRAGLADAFLGPIGFSLIPTLLAYGLTRTKWYRAGIFIFSTAFSSLAYVSMAGEGTQADISALLLIYVPLSLIVASTFLSSWAVFLLTGLNVGALFLTLSLSNAITPDNIGAQSGIITTVGLVLIALSNFRKSNERLRLESLRQVNQQLEDARVNLEQRVAERTYDLELASEVGRTITARVGNLSQLLSESVESIRQRFELYYTQVYLVDRAGRLLLLHAGTGDVGRQLLQRGHKLALNMESLNGRAALEKRTVIVQDTRSNPNFLPNPLLPGTRSEMAIPLVAGDRVVGVLDMQSEQPNALNEENLTAFEALAGQLAVAIQNSSLFEQVNQARTELEEQAKMQSLAGWSTFLDAVERGEKIGFVYNQNELLPLVDTEREPNSENTLHAPIHVAGAEIGKLYIADTQNRKWTTAEADIMHNTSLQLSRHIENLRLLAQSEKYRRDAEDATKRLTREGWETFLQTRSDLATGYMYDLNNVHTLQSENHNGHFESTLTKQLIVRNETVGELTVNIGDNSPEEIDDLIAAVAEQLAEHIEGLRLLEATQSELIERTRAEKELLRVRLGMDRTNDAVFITEIDGTIIYVNPAFERIYGWTAKEAIGQTPRILKSGVIPAEQYVHFWDALKNNKVVAGEIVNKTKDGRLIPIEGNNNPIVDADGKVIGFLGMHRDITDRKKAEEAIAKAQEQYSLAVAGSNDGIWDWDITNNDIYYSARWKGMLGYEEHELTRGFVEWEDLIHPEDRDRAVKALDDYIEQRAPEYNIEIRLRHKDGSWRWINDRGKALRHPDGTAYRMAGSHTDVTERKHNEELIAERAQQLETVAALSSTTSALLDPDQLLQTVVDLTRERFELYHAHIYLFDEAWNTLMLASGSGEVGRRMVSDGWSIPLTHPSSMVASAARSHKYVIANNILRDPNARFLSNALLPDTRSEMAIPMIVGDKLLGVFDVQADTVDFFTQEDANIYTTLASQVAVALQNARLYAEQAATVSQLRELDRLKSSFLANMSHELRTPLNSILGFTDVMLEGLDGELTPYMDNDLRLIQKNGQHLLHLINDVLDMAKIESGRMNLVIEPCDLHEVMEDVTRITSSLAHEKQIALYIEPDSEKDIVITADRTRLRQVLINLVNNSIKFTETGSVSMFAVREANTVLIKVKDTGIGIPPAQLDAIFQEFTQVDTSTTRKAGGTGLGLPISRRLIEMHGGRLWGESSGIEGEGATFYVILPIEAKTSEPEEATARAA